ncbi:MAG: putative quinol monooxygenase [Sphingomonas sp.]
MIARRPMLAGVAMAVLAAWGGTALAAKPGLYGLIGKIKCKPGKRRELLAVLTDDWGEMPGCSIYMIAEDIEDDDAVWVSEVWDSREAHRASLQLPGVKDAIARGRPLIAGFEMSVETRPVPVP